MSTNANYPPRDRSTSPRIGVAFWRQKRKTRCELSNGPRPWGLQWADGGAEGCAAGSKGAPLKRCSRLGRLPDSEGRFSVKGRRLWIRRPSTSIWHARRELRPGPSRLPGPRRPSKLRPGPSRLPSLRRAGLRLRPRLAPRPGPLLSFLPCRLQMQSTRPPWRCTARWAWWS